MTKGKEYQAAFLVMLAYAVFSFVSTLIESSGMDISVIKDVNQSVCYSQNSRLWFFFALAYPFLIVLPFAASYVDDYKNQLLPVFWERL